jgi:lipopolysaccharide export system protein LptA
MWALLLGCAPLAGWAEKADRDQPMNAESDALRYDDAKLTSVFTGNVVITKGSIVIRGQRVDVRQDPQGNQFGTAHASADKLAFFRQKREGLDEFIEGEATRIDYDSQQDKVTFTGKAVLRRFRGVTLGDETRGSLIVYDNKTEVFTVDGNRAEATPANPTGRVRAMLTPAPKPSAPATTSPTPPALRNSTNLEPRR